MPILARINIHPVKSLDQQSVEEAVILPSGAIEHDRRFALANRAGEYMTGKLAPAIHHVRSHFEPATRELSLRLQDANETVCFHVDSDRAALESWFSNYFDTPLSLVENEAAGFPDDTEASGPTVISVATLAEVGSWFGLDVPDVRSRFRANLEIEGVEPFWEDRLVPEGFGGVRFQIGAARLLGVNPCARCPVPSRNQLTGEAIKEFAKSFATRRRETLPPWAPASRFDHFYRLATNTRPVRSQPQTIRVGDEIRILD